LPVIRPRLAGGWRARPHGLSRPAASGSVEVCFAGRIGWRASIATRLRGHLIIERVGIVGPQEVQGEDGNYYDQHDDGHKDYQDRSDHHTIPLTWPRAALARLARPYARASPGNACTLSSAADPLDQRLCRTLYALSRNSRSFAESLG
jgi:hypothetical protein